MKTIEPATRLSGGAWPGRAGFRKDGGAYSLQVVWPFSLNEDWRLISYTILPVHQVPVPGESTKVGLGDTLINLFAAPKKPGKWSNASARWPRTGARFTFRNQKAVLAFSVQA